MPRIVNTPRAKRVQPPILGPRRGVFVNIEEQLGSEREVPDEATYKQFEELDVVYRSLCAAMFNYVPTSGHPGGSISSGRIVQALLFKTMDYDLSQPDRAGGDLLVFGAGHKALGLYALWALRNEVARLAAPELLPRDERNQLRLEDLLGFRRNPTTETPLFAEFAVKPLDGHPTPATPFVPLATGASGVGTAAALGLAWAAADLNGPLAQRVHIVEGEGGLTPGRVAEALAFAGTASLSNAVLHVDWNQASIDSEHVCRVGSEPGDYVQWTPTELAYLHDWNVIYVPDGFDYAQIFAAQQAAQKLENGQPTAIVYRTVKGWHYGIEGAASHGAGHPLCSDGFYRAVAPLLLAGKPAPFPSCEPRCQRCGGGARADVLERCYWGALTLVRRHLEERRSLVDALARRLRESRSRLERRSARPLATTPRLHALFDTVERVGATAPAELRLAPGTRTTLREQFGRTLAYLNEASSGAVVAAAADLLGSTSVGVIGKPFSAGYYNMQTNPGARLLSIGGICEDGMAGVLSGVAAFGYHVGVGASYAAFNAPLGHVAARLHAIGAQAREQTQGKQVAPLFLVCAHAGVKTGEDGPTHADPQALQLLQGDFPDGSLVTLTPWDPQEIWPLTAAALKRRPAVIAPFLTRPSEAVLDRAAIALAPAEEAGSGVYRLAGPSDGGDGVVVLQGSAVTYAFVEDALPLLRADGIHLTVYYIASAELFDTLPEEERESIFPESHARRAMGITDFTEATMHRWVTSRHGRRYTLHPFRHGRFLGSGSGRAVMREAGIDGQAQADAIRSFIASAEETG